METEYDAEILNYIPVLPWIFVPMQKLLERQFSPIILVPGMWRLDDSFDSSGEKIN
jgi:hypothetical protein